MIPMTADEIATLVRARDILADKATRPETGGLALGVHDGLKLLLRVSYVEPEAQNTPEIPMPTPGPTGEPPESPGEAGGGNGGTTGNGPPLPIWGKPFKPQHPTQPKVETKDEPTDLDEP